MHQRTLTLLAVLLLGLMTSVAQASRLNRGTASEPNTLDPQSAVGNSAAAILYDLFMGLTTFDAAGKTMLGVAESFAVSEDGTSYTFTLREDARWSDGTPITAEDFVFSGRRLVNPATGARFAAFFYPVKGAREIIRGRAEPDQLGVYADDERTVRYELVAPAAYFPQLLATNAAAPVPKHVIEEFGRQWTRPGRMVSNGAYMLSEWIPQSYVQLEKNPRFFAADDVAIESVYYYPTQNLTTSLNRFRAGELDVILNFPPNEMEWLQENMPDQLHVTPSLAIYYFLINHRKPPFDDIRVRKALSLSVDRAGMIAKLINTGVTPAHRISPDALSTYSGPEPDWAQQPMGQRMAEARKLLAEAGFTRDKPLSFTLKVDTLEESRKIAVALTSMWRGIGVKATVENSDLATLNKMARTGDYEVMRYAWFAPYDDAETFLALLETGNPNNLSGYSQPQYDALLREARATLDPTARVELMTRAETLAMADFPVIPLYFYAGRRLVNTRVGVWVDNARAANPTRFLTLR